MMKAKVLMLKDLMNRFQNLQAIRANNHQVALMSNKITFLKSILYNTFLFYAKLQYMTAGCFPVEKRDKVISAQS